MIEIAITLEEALSYLKYNGPIIDSTKNSNTFWRPIPSVELAQGCNSESFLFYQYLLQGFLVNCSPYFKGSYFRVRYFNYELGKYWP